MLVLGIVLLILGIVFYFIGINADNDDWDWVCSGYAYCFWAGIAITLGVLYIQSNDEITPMDVYQGKTTLQYTIVDGVKVDSVVVWKNKEE